MTTYTPPPFPRRPSPANATVFSLARYHLQLLYYRYEINTALYVMSPGEKLAYNLIVLALLAMFVTSVYYYFPYTVKYTVWRLGYYLTGFGPGRSVESVGQVVVRSEMEMQGLLAAANGLGAAGNASLGEL